MKKFCVIGHPINHSLSPKIHQAAMVDIEIDGSFEKLDIPTAELKDWVEKNFRENFHGAAITIPHKEPMLDLADKVTQVAKDIGAINTLYWEKDKIIGTNTDGVGFMRALVAQTSVQEKRILILGFGGAAKAIIYAMSILQNDISVWSRSSEKVESASRNLNIHNVESIQSLNPDHFDIIINTTPVGMNSQESILPASFWRAHHVAFDIVYTPLETRFLFEAEQAGAQIITGDKMLIYQAVEQFKLWHDTEIDPQVMEQAFLETEA